MRLIVFILLSSLSVLTVFSQPGTPKPFRLTGEISGIPDVEKVYLSYVHDGERITDSAIVNNGAYQFSGILSEPALGRMSAAMKVKNEGVKPLMAPKDMALVFLEAAHIKVSNKDSFVNIKVKGSRAHEAYADLEEKLKTNKQLMKELNAEYSALYKNKDSAGMKALEPRFDQIGETIKNDYREYFLDNPRSPVAVYVLSQFAGWDIDPDKVGPLFERLPAPSKDLPSAKVLREKIETARKTGIGRTAMDFVQNDTLGNPVSLSSFRGKYVLIDFWASWCGPCRVENPNVVKAFQDFSGKGFTVLGISLDRPNDKEKWLKAIHDDKLTWTHVSDLQFWKNAVAVQYGIQAIPQNLLIDPDGKIIGKNLRGEDLQRKLAEILN